MKEQFVKIFAEQTMAQLELSINNYLKKCPAKIISTSYTTDNKYVFSERAMICFERE
jgi:hypothetical protein